MESKLKKSIATDNQRLNAENCSLESILTTTMRNWVLSDQYEVSFILFIAGRKVAPIIALH